MGSMYAYCRVSSPDQNEDRQIICMRELQVPKENIFVDKQSGKDFNRPQFKKKTGQSAVNHRTVPLIESLIDKLV